MKILLALFLLISSLSWGNLILDNLYKENEYELNSIAHCKGFLQGIVDIFDFLDNEYSEVIKENSSEEEIEEFRNFQTELNNFNNITGDELDFQLGMKCGKDNQCRAEYANTVIKVLKKDLETCLCYMKQMVMDLMIMLKSILRTVMFY
jgi:hypothetical protein